MKSCSESYFELSLEKQTQTLIDNVHRYKTSDVVDAIKYCVLSTGHSAQFRDAISLINDTLELLGEKK